MFRSPPPLLFCMSALISGLSFSVQAMQNNDPLAVKCAAFIGGDGVSTHQQKVSYALMNHSLDHWGAVLATTFGTTPIERDSAHKGLYLSVDLGNGEEITLRDANPSATDQTVLLHAMLSETNAARLRQALDGIPDARESQPRRPIAQSPAPTAPTRKPVGKINVIDVESTCWEGPAPGGQVSEIIEIGISVLDPITLQVLSTESLLVRPTQSEVSPFCTKLTTITQEMLADAMGFEEVLQILRKKYKSRERLFASYGDYDRRMFQRQCERLGVPYPFGDRHLNVKNLYALSQGLTSEVGMAASLRDLGFELEGTHHRGGDDSRNIARILGALLGRTRQQR